MTHPTPPTDRNERPPAPTTPPDRAGSVDLTSPPASTPTDDGSAPMPHERDEGVGMTDGKPDARMRQGERDLKRGVSDTSRGAEADRAYDQLKRR